MNTVFRKQIAIPQDHGSWVFILSPLLIGIFAGRVLDPGTIGIVAATMAAFLARQPLTTIVKAYSGRRPRSDLPPALLWSGVYGLIALLALGELLWLGDGYIVYLAIPGIPVFAWHLWLVSRRAERRQAMVEIIATGVLSLAGPGAYWIGVGHYDPLGWWLWLLTWLQSAASILYAYLRLEQRNLAGVPVPSVQWQMARYALMFTSFNLAFSFGLGSAGLVPRLIFIPYSIQWLETLWGASHPAIRAKPVAIGMRQLFVSCLWMIVFILIWARA